MYIEQRSYLPDSNYLFESLIALCERLDKLDIESMV